MVCSFHSIVFSVMDVMYQLIVVYRCYEVRKTTKNKAVKMSSYSDSELKMDAKNKPRKIYHVTFKSKARFETEFLKNFKTVLKRMRLPSSEERKLIRAANTNNTEYVQELLEAKVNPNIKDGRSRSILHLAVSKGYADVVRLLLQYGADPNVEDIIGNTPLHLAACTSNLESMKHLLNFGADVNLLDIHGRNPVQLAESKLHMLRNGWRSGTIESLQLRQQLQHIVDIMISLKIRKEKLANDVGDLELFKLSLNAGPEEEVDNQMSRLLDQLKDFSLK